MRPASAAPAADSADIPAAPKTPASSLPSAGRSRTAAPPPAGSVLPHTPPVELARIVPRLSSPALCPSGKRPSTAGFLLRRNRTIRLLLLRDFLSGAYISAARSGDAQLQLHAGSIR